MHEDIKTQAYNEKEQMQMWTVSETRQAQIKDRDGKRRIALTTDRGAADSNRGYRNEKKIVVDCAHVYLKRSHYKNWPSDASQIVKYFEGKAFRWHSVARRDVNDY